MPTLIAAVGAMTAVQMLVIYTLMMLAGAALGYRMAGREAAIARGAFFGAIHVAAAFAGAIGPEGGRVKVDRVQAPSVYRGTESNGVTTSDFTAYNSAYVVEGGTENVGLKVCGRLEALAVSTCTCPANGPVGSVWGSGPYTLDSDICTAARHAGVIGAEGGEVTVRRVAGLAAYTGDTANGVTTSDWGSHGASFTFGGKDSGQAP